MANRDQQSRQQPPAGRSQQPQQAQSGAGGQQGAGQAGSRQQQQFEQPGRQPSGSGADSRFVDQIRPQLSVVDDQGNHIGTVDHLDGDRIKLTRSDSSDNEHHYIPLSQVAGIEGDKVRLRERGDNDFGQEAGR